MDCRKSEEKVYADTGGHAKFMTSAFLIGRKRTTGLPYRRLSVRCRALKVNQKQRGYRSSAGISDNTPESPFYLKYRKTLFSDAYLLPTSRLLVAYFSPTCCLLLACLNSLRQD